MSFGLFNTVVVKTFLKEKHLDSVARLKNIVNDYGNSSTMDYLSGIAKVGY